MIWLFWGEIMANKKKKKRKTSTKNTSKKRNTKKKTTTRKTTKTSVQSKVSKSTKKPASKSTKKPVTKASSKKTSKKSNKVEIPYLSRIVLMFALALILVFILLGIVAIKKDREAFSADFEKINLSKYLKLYEEKDSTLQFVYITKDDCYMCDTYEVNLSKLESEFKIKIKEFNITNLSDSDIKKLENSASFLTSGVHIPTVLAIKDGREINALSGVKQYSALKKFAEYSKNPTINSFVSISLNKYLSLLDSKDTTVIYIGSSISKACIEYSKVLETVSSKKGIKVNYLDTEDILTEDGWDKINNSNEIFKGEWFWPTTLVVKNGNIVNYKMEAMDEEDLTNFFDKSGL